MFGSDVGPDPALPAVFAGTDPANGDLAMGTDPRLSFIGPWPAVAVGTDPTPR